MIYSPLSSLLRTRELALAANTQPSADGQAMVATLVGGISGVQPSTGAAGEKFAGFVASQTSAASFLQTTAVAVEVFTTPSSKTVTLGRAPIAGTTQVKIEATNAPVAVDGVADKVVDLSTAGVPGQVVVVTYRYTLSVIEARSRVGDVTPGGYAGLTTGSVSLVQAGTVYTDQFDTSLDWGMAGESVVLGPNGQLSTKTANANGAPVSSYIVSLPTTDYPFLGIDFDLF